MAKKFYYCRGLCLGRIGLMVAGFCTLAPWAAVADLPIHGTIKDIKGNWTFFLTPSVTGAVNSCGSSAPNRNTENLQPSIAESEEYLKKHGGVATTLKLKLGDEMVPFSDIQETAENPHRGTWQSLAVQDAETGKTVGGWTTVYDEGFEVFLRDKTRLMAFLKYNKNDACPETKDGDMEDPNGRTECYTTDPNRTQLGWYIMTGNGVFKSGCFYGEKANTSSETPAPVSFVYVRQRVSEGGEKALRSWAASPDISYYVSKEFVDKHNEKLNSTWKATYESPFIQQHRMVLSSLIKNFGFSKVNSIDGIEAMPSFLQGQSSSIGGVISQLYACPCKAGEVVQDTRGESRSSNAVLSPVSMLQSTTSAMDVKEHEQGLLPDSGVSTSALQSGELPKAFAWPNPFTNPSFKEHATNQGDCGSCYAIAAVYALEKRFEIAASKLLGHKVSVFSGVEIQQGQESLLEHSRPRLSPQSVLSCSYYNQGCHGGFPYLVGKHAAEMGVLEERCMPYSGLDGLFCPALQGTKNKEKAAEFSADSFLMTFDSEKGSCHAGERRWFAKDYGYVGGCYECGNCANEKNIMAEIYANGPVTAALDAPASLFAYNAGVYDTEDAPHARVCDNPSPLGAPNGLNGWEFTNHAVNIVGWGETEATETSPSQKYWIVRNTWGPTWGHRGYFLLARGKNAGGIESQVSYIDPDFSRGMGRALLEKLGRGSQNPQTTKSV